MDIRILDDSDQQKLEAFLIGHRDSSMFLRANALRVGLVYRDAAFHALYAAAIRRGNTSSALLPMHGAVWFCCSAPGRLTNWSADASRGAVAR